MAKEFARAFYNSQRWKKCRDGYFEYRFGLCEVCEKPGQEVHHKIHITPNNIGDNNITTNWDNLQLLCKSCHGEAHDKAWRMIKQRLRKVRSTREGTMFDEHGNLVEVKSVTIVWGAPASGKTTYVRDNKGEYDIVVDLDYINSALSLSLTRERSDDVLPFGIDVRDYIYELIAERKYFFEHCWVIAQLPTKKERSELANKLKANLIHIDTEQEMCRLRVMSDDDRKDKQEQIRYIARFFDRLELE
jgi:predicted kinase